jgi:hypothetical protein
VDSGEKISRELVVACRDGTKVLEFVEEAFDEVAFAVECEVASPRKFAVGFWRNHRGYSPLSESVDQLICVVSLIAKQGIRIDAVDQLLRASQIVGLPRREHQFDRIAQGIDERMDFGRQSAAGSADRLFAVFFRAPALC